MTDDVVRLNGPEWTAMLRVLYTLTDYEMRAHEGADGPSIIEVAADAEATLETLEQRLVAVERALEVQRSLDAQPSGVDQ